jgi:hypothetical protein
MKRTLTDSAQQTVAVMYAHVPPLGKAANVYPVVATE